MDTFYIESYKNGKRNRKFFNTLAEAQKEADRIHRATGVFVGIEKSKKGRVSSELSIVAKELKSSNRTIKDMVKAIEKVKEDLSEGKEDLEAEAKEGRMNMGVLGYFDLAEKALDSAKNALNALSRATRIP